MDANDRGRAQGIADAILEHLRRHPLAADSAEGVARWWPGACCGVCSSATAVRCIRSACPPASDPCDARISFER
jgi:hypothetical protein